jgi:hypothetical protein
MERLPHAPLDEPATYRILITGVLESDLAERHWGMTSSPFEKIGEPEQTVLVGEVADQAVLVGIINALYNYGHTVVSVERLLPDADPHMDDTNEET